MMSAEAVLQTLESLGSEQTRKTYGRHGVKGPLYGVSYADLTKLAKKIKTNHSITQELWVSKNHDARILSLMIADPKQATSGLLDVWVTDLSDYVLSDALAVFVGKTSIAREKMEVWTQSPEEWVSTVGWNLLAALVKNDPAMPDSYFEPYISTVEHAIHGSKNRTRHAMNSAIIAIATRVVLEQQALDAAVRIGKVIVDHGDTNCKTVNAVITIKKASKREIEKA